MGERKRRLAAGASRQPAYHVDRIRGALRALEAGERQIAEEAFAELLSAAIRDPDLLHGAAILGLRLGRHAEAAALLADAITQRPEHGPYRLVLAVAHRLLGNPALAIEQLQSALALQPDLAEAHAELGRVLLATGRADEAVQAFERALALRPEYADALSGLAATRFAQAQLEMAADRDASASMALALEQVARAVRISPENPAYWVQFSDCARFFSLRDPIDPALRQLLARALEHPAVDPGNLVRPISTLALSRADCRPLEEPLLIGMLEHALVRDPALERAIVSARRAALCELSEPAMALEPLGALAMQCFTAEYVYEESGEERARVAALEEKILHARRHGEAVPPHWHAVYGCYRALHALEGAEAVASELAATPLSRLARRQIAEPLEEQRLRHGIRALSAPDDAVSRAVQAQYEANPYPRWLRAPVNVAPGTVATLLRELFPRAQLQGALDAAARILIAGCGTGQNAIATAQRFVARRILAVDLSLASLAYARRKSLELGLPDIEYCQADILRLGELEERFDLIDSSGVLHHMAEPLEGWRVLTGLLAPGGFMRIALYSEAGRRHVVRARELIAAEGLQPTPEGIRQCRAAILARQDDPLLARFARSEDFYSMSGCRDLLFNVQEHRFTLPRIAGMIAALGLEFLGFELADGGVSAGRYRGAFPGDPALADLQSWARFEQTHPDTFSLMYQFWLRKPL
jgi:SAM-dependent methyltransferase